MGQGSKLLVFVEVCKNYYQDRFVEGQFYKKRSYSVATSVTLVFLPLLRQGQELSRSPLTFLDCTYVPYDPYPSHRVLRGPSSGSCLLQFTRSIRIPRQLLSDPDGTTGYEGTLSSVVI